MRVPRVPHPCVDPAEARSSSNRTNSIRETYAQYILLDPVLSAEKECYVMTLPHPTFFNVIVQNLAKSNAVAKID